MKALRLNRVLAGICAAIMNLTSWAADSSPTFWKSNDTILPTNRSFPSPLNNVDPEWTTPIPPFQIADNLYYVGSRDLAAYLVTAPSGHILINANLDSSPNQIRRSVEKLGFNWSDVRILLNSQAHYDHMGGAAEIIRETHAKNTVMDGDANVVETGAQTDFLAPSPNVPGYAPVHVDRVLHDGEKRTHV